MHENLKVKALLINQKYIRTFIADPFVLASVAVTCPGAILHPHYHFTVSLRFQSSSICS